MDNEQLAAVKLMGGLGYTPAQIGVALQIPAETVEEDMKDENSDFYKTYYAGYYDADIRLWNSIFKLANAGSGPAQVMAAKRLAQSETRKFYEQ